MRLANSTVQPDFRDRLETVNNEHARLAVDGSDENVGRDAVKIAFQSRVSRSFRGSLWPAAGVASACLNVAVTASPENTLSTSVSQILKRSFASCNACFDRSLPARISSILRGRRGGNRLVVADAVLHDAMFID